ncbi:hypothetical protein GGI43DRAFT_282834 [Trichoderma evansii]
MSTVRSTCISDASCWTRLVTAVAKWLESAVFLSLLFLSICLLDGVCDVEMLCKASQSEYPMDSAGTSTARVRTAPKEYLCPLTTSRVVCSSWRGRRPTHRLRRTCNM